MQQCQQSLTRVVYNEIACEKTPVMLSSSDNSFSGKSFCSSSEYLTENSDSNDSDIFEPYDDNVEPLASAEDLSKYQASLE